MNKKRFLPLIAVAAAAILALPAGATPGSGATGTVLARGLATEKIKSQSSQPFDVVVQQITIAPVGNTGWHTHPGNAVAVVKAGTLTIYDADDPTCTGRDYTAGQVYLDPGRGHVHFGANRSATEFVEVVVTYLDVPVGGGVRQDAPNPGNCSF
jgi:quercetin dioxygenase-like cupin family protein